MERVREHELPVFFWTAMHDFFKLNTNSKHPQIDRWLVVSFWDWADMYVPVDSIPTSQKLQLEPQTTNKLSYRARKATKRFQMLRMRWATYLAEKRGKQLGRFLYQALYPRQRLVSILIAKNLILLSNNLRNKKCLFFSCELVQFALFRRLRQKLVR